MVLDDVLRRYLKDIAEKEGRGAVSDLAEQMGFARSNRTTIYDFIGARGALSTDRLSAMAAKRYNRPQDFLLDLFALANAMDLEARGGKAEPLPGQAATEAVSKAMPSDAAPPVPVEKPRAPRPGRPKGRGAKSAG